MAGWPFEPPVGTVLDQGRLVVAHAGPHSRSERYLLVRRADGRHVLASQICADDGSYDVWAWLEYDTAFLPLAARGGGRRGDQEVAVSLTLAPPLAHIAARLGAVAADPREIAYRPGWLVDLEPSAMPMIAMLRRFDPARAGDQRFHWIGRSLTRDLVLEDGIVDLRRIGDADVDGEQQTQFQFDETLAPGAPPLRFDLWVDAEFRFRRFVLTGPGFSVAGARAGDADALPA